MHEKSSLIFDFSFSAWKSESNERKSLHLSNLHEICSSRLPYTKICTAIALGIMSFLYAVYITHEYLF